jgi:hypothetical protein
MHLLHDLWFWSVLLNAVSALAMVGFAILLTDGAGFGSYPALLRLLQRLAFCVMAFAMMCCALLQIRVQAVAPQWFFFQLAFMAVWIVSVLRHITSPAIPEDARWGRKIVTELKVDYGHAAQPRR